MILKNSTNLNSQQLKSIFLRCVKEVEKIEKPDLTFNMRKDYYVLQVMNGRFLRGRATIRGCWSMIKIPREWQIGVLDFDKKQKIARMMIHEYYHNIGFKNFDRQNYKFDTAREWLCDWIADYPLAVKEEKTKVKTDIQMVRYQRALKNLENAKTRFNRSKTILKKWQKKVKYYQVTFANRNIDK